MPRSTKPKPQLTAGPMRLQRLLAQAGLGSRRECETLILDGRVEVDGQTVDRMGVRVDPSQQKVLCDGSPVRVSRFQYFAVNKPPGVLSTSRDPAGRLRVIDLIETDQRVYTVGRLDKSSEGLILVTNDGDLANRLMHPRYGVEKTYLVTVAGRPTIEQLQQLERGVYLSEGVARVAEIRIKKRRKQSTDLKIVLNEGRNREIRRLLAHIGHKVTRLKRIAIGPLHLNELPLGSYRRLEHPEVERLRRARPHSPSRAKKPRGKSSATAKPSRNSTVSDRGPDKKAGASRPAKRTSTKKKKVTAKKPGPSPRGSGTGVVTGPKPKRPRGSPQAGRAASGRKKPRASSRKKAPRKTTRRR